MGALLVLVYGEMPPEFKQETFHRHGRPLAFTSLPGPGRAPEEIDAVAGTLRCLMPAVL